MDFVLLLDITNTYELTIRINSNPSNDEQSTEKE
jgi:hypothetical protein